jgi:uncharacterized protein
VVKKTGPKPKHIPLRTCVGCHLVLAKRSLIRVIRTPQGVVVDPTGKAAGRGAYLHNQRSCWERGLKGALGHALKVDLTKEDIETLRVFSSTLPDETLKETDTSSIQGCER